MSALYEQSRVHNVGAPSTLEDQMCSFTSDFDRDHAKASPDRVDALVWAFTELMVEGTAQAWINHFGAMAAPANAFLSPVAGDSLPCRPRPAPSRPVEQNELIDIYSETANATLLSGRDRRCTAA